MTSCIIKFERIFGQQIRTLITTMSLCRCSSSVALNQLPSKASTKVDNIRTNIGTDSITCTLPQTTRHVHWNPILVQLFRTTEHFNNLRYEAVCLSFFESIFSPFRFRHLSTLQTVFFSFSRLLSVSICLNFLVISSSGTNKSEHF